jgi:hypothetical protein
VRDGKRAVSFWDAALFVSAVSTVVPLWCARFLPFSDMPEHVAVIATLRHWFDPSWHTHDVYALAIGKSQYVLYHVVGALVSIATGEAELANRVLLTAVGLSLPYALRSLARALDRDERLALFAAPAFWSRPLLMGFLPYVASLPAVTWGLALSARQARAPTRGRAIGLAVLAIALFYLHGDAFLLFALGAVALRVVLGEGPPLRVARDLSWLGPSAATAAGWALYGRVGAEGSSLRDSVGQMAYVPLKELARELPMWSFDIWRGHVDELCAAALWGSFALLALQLSPTEASSSRPRRLRWAAAVPFLCAALGYVAMPWSIGAGVMLNVRLASFVSMFAPLMLEPARGALAVLPLVGVLGAGTINSAYAAHEVYRAEHDELGAVNRLIDQVPGGARIVTLPFHFTSAFTHWGPWGFLGSYVRARRGGVASFSFTELGHWPLQFRAEAAPPRKAPFWTFSPCLFRNETDGAYYDYVLVRGKLDPFRDAPPGPRWKSVDRDGEFVLYEKVGGEWNPPWRVEDGGPCKSRWSLEHAPESP